MGALKSGLKRKECSELLDSFADLATAEVKKAGKFTIPGLCMIKTRVKPARKAGTRVAFGKTIKVKAAPAKKIVKAFCVSASRRASEVNHFCYRFDMQVRIQLQVW